MGQATPIKTHYSYEEYLALEQTDNIRYEYYQGEVFAMAGGTKRHNRIVRNLILSNCFKLIVKHSLVMLK